MRFLEAPLVWSKRKSFGYPPALGGMSASVHAFGLPSGNGWQSDPVDARGQISLSLEYNFSADAGTAMLYIPSTTTGLGLLAVATSPDVEGNEVQITVNAPAGTTRGIVTTTDSVVISPAVGDNNANIAELVNGTQASTTLVGAISATASTIPVASTAGFSPTGTLDINDTTGAVEQIAYVGLGVVGGLPAFLGCTGGTAGRMFAAGASAALDNPASALVQLYPWGWQGYGDMTVVPQDNPTQGAEIDLVAAMSITSLAGGGTAAPAGALSLFGSNSPNDIGYDPVALANVVIGATGPGTLTVNPLNHRWVVAKFVPSGASIGQVAGNWFGRASA